MGGVAMGFGRVGLGLGAVGWIGEVVVGGWRTGVVDLGEEWGWVARRYWRRARAWGAVRGGGRGGGVVVVEVFGGGCGAVIVGGGCGEVGRWRGGCGD